MLLIEHKRIRCSRLRIRSLSSSMTPSCLLTLRQRRQQRGHPAVQCSQMPTSAKISRQLVPSLGPIMEVALFDAQDGSEDVLRCLSSKATFSPLRKSLRPDHIGAGTLARLADLDTPGADG